MSRPPLAERLLSGVATTTSSRRDSFFYMHFTPHLVAALPACGVPDNIAAPRLTIRAGHADVGAKFRAATSGDFLG